MENLDELHPTYQELEKLFFKDNPQAAYDLLLAYELKLIHDWIIEVMTSDTEHGWYFSLHDKRDTLASRVRALMLSTGQYGEQPRCPCWIHGCRG